MKRTRVVLILCFVAATLLLPTQFRAYAFTYSSDLTTTGQAISGGDNAAHLKADAFDDNTATYWASSQGAGSCIGAAYIGQDFGAGNEKEIRYFTVRSVAGSVPTYTAFQFSDDNSVWGTALVIARVNTSGIFSYPVDSFGAHRYWRLLCNGNPAGTYVEVEIEMMAILANTATPSGDTPTPTLTLTPSVTPSLTPNYAIEITATSGAPIKLERSATYGDLTVFAGLLALAVLTFIMFAYNYWRERINADTD